MGVDAEMFARIRGRENWVKPEEPIATFKPSSERNPRTGALSYGLDVSHLDGTPWKRTAGNWGSMCNAMEPILRTISDEREAQRVAA